jgi:hypothetical protein
MPDLPPTFFFEQQQVLREIRDELRSQRMAPGTMGATPSYSPRETGAMLQAQGFSDRMLLNDWKMFGWSQAYQPEMRSSLARDIFGSMGFYPPPNTMTGMEYQQMAAENIGLRTGTMVRGMMAPFSTIRGNRVAEELYQMSPRFLRAGDQGAGILGAGMDRTTSRTFARQLELQALGDPKLSFGNYETIMSTGLRSGQFDFASSTREFSEQLRSLARTTADLTRATRMSVEDITRTMGALRQFGVADFAEQGRITRQVAAAARVAGVSNAEMAQAATAAIAAGLPMGIAAHTSAAMMTGDVTVLRELARGGIISPHLLAAGGGTMAVAGQITQARQQFLGSIPGALALGGGLAGPGQGDYFQALTKGLAGTGGGLAGISRMLAGRLEGMGMVGEPQADHMMRQMVESQMRLMGVQDPMSQQGQDMAFMLLRGRMGEPAALAYARSNFSRQGRMSADAARFRILGDAQNREDQVAADRAYEADTFAGASRRVLASLGRGWAGVVNATEQLFSPGAEGFKRYYFGGDRVGGRLEAEIARYQYGAPNTASTRAIAEYMAAGPVQRGLMDRELTVYGNQAQAQDWWRTGIAYGVPAVAGTLVGLAAGPVAGIAAGIALTIPAMSWAQSHFPDENRVKLGLTESNTYRAMVAANERPGAKVSARAQALVSGRESTTQGMSLGASTNFMKWVTKANTGEMSGKDIQQLTTDVGLIVSETGESIETVTESLKQAGMNLDLINAYAGKSDLKKPSAAFRELFTGTALGGEPSLISGTSAEAVLRLMEARPGQETLSAMTSLRAAGFDKKSIDELRANIGKAAKAGTSRQLMEDLRGHKTNAARDAANRMLRPAVQRARELAGELTDPMQANRAREMLEGLKGQEVELVTALASSDKAYAPLQEALGSSEAFRQAMAIGRDKELTSQGVEQLTKKYTGLDPRAIRDLQSMKLGEEAYRKNLMAQVLNPASVGPTGAEVRAQEVDILGNAAKCLERAAQLMGFTVDSKSKGVNG